MVTRSMRTLTGRNSHRSNWTCASLPWPCSLVTRVLPTRHQIDELRAQRWSQATATTVSASCLAGDRDARWQYRDRCAARSSLGALVHRLAGVGTAGTQLREGLRSAPVPCEPLAAPPGRLVEYEVTEVVVEVARGAFDC